MSEPTSPLAHSRRSAASLLAGGLLIAIAVVAGHALGSAWGHPTTGELIALTPTVPAASPPQLVAPLSDVARNALWQTVTVEVVTAKDEQLGTAWLFDSRGDFVTNAHVVAGALSIRLRDRDGGTHVATVVGADSEHDVAVIRSSDGFSAPPLPLAHRAADVADQVVAIGSSRATGHSDVTVETVNRLGVEVSARGNPDVEPGSNASTVVYHSMIAVSGTAIFQGNSGGPLLNNRGQVVGIITLASRTQPEAYAIPIERIVNEIRNYAAQP